MLFEERRTWVRLETWTSAARAKKDCHLKSFIRGKMIMCLCLTAKLLVGHQRTGSHRSELQRENNSYPSSHKHFKQLPGTSKSNTRLYNSRALSGTPIFVTSSTVARINIKGNTLSRIDDFLSWLWTQPNFLRNKTPPAKVELNLINNRKQWTEIGN